MSQPDRPNPYVGPYSFEEKNANLFFGRDDEARALLSLVVSERVTVLCAPSGAGKTSLLNARLVPGLRQESFHVLPVARVGGELPPGISPANVYAFNVICKLAGAGADLVTLQTQTLDGYLRLSPEADDEETARVLILDQFEEVLTTHPGRWEDRRGFFVQLRQALLDDPALSVVLALREDHLAGLDPFAVLLPGQLRTRFRLERLRRDRAVDAVRKPAEAAGRPFEEGVAERLLENLSQIHLAGQETTVSGEFVEPVQLQVVCYQLWDNLRDRPGDTITEQDRKDFGDIDQALERFYDSAVERAAQESGVPALRIRRFCGKALITPTRIRSQVVREPETSGGLPNVAVDRLVDLHLIRGEAIRGGIWYELAHDRFIDPVLRSNKKAQPPEVTRLAADARAWDQASRDRSFLYSGQQLETAEDLVGPGSGIVSRLEKEFLEAARAEEENRKIQRTRRLRIAVTALAGLVLVLGGLAYLTWEQRQIATSRELALAAMSKAEADPDRGLRLALEAVSRAATPEAEAALHHALSTPVVRPHQSLPIISDSASAFAFSPDGSRFAAVTEDRRVSVWGSQKSRLIRTLPPARSVITAVAFSPDGDRLAVGDVDGDITLWPVTTGPPLASLVVGEPINAIAFSPDGSLLAVASDSPEASLWNTETGKRVRSFSDGHSDFVWDVAINTAGTQLATAGEDGLAILWDVASGRTIKEPFRHPQAVTGLAFGPDGELATACHDHLIRIWDIEGDRGILKILAGHQDWVWDVAFNSDGQYLASASFDNTTKLWDARSGKELHTLPAGGPVTRVEFKPSPGREDVSLAMAARAWSKGSGRATFWTVLPEEVTVLRLAAAPVDVGFIPQGNSLVITTKNGQTILRTADGKNQTVPSNAPQAPGFQSQSVRLSPDGRRLATVDKRIKGGQPDYDLSVREIPSGREILRRNLGQGYLSSISLSLDGHLLAIIAGDIRLWDLQKGQEIPFPRHDSLDVTFSSDGKLLATAGVDGTRIWTLDGHLVHTLASYGSPVLLVAFSPDGSLLATASLDLSIRLWEVASGRELHMLRGHTGRVSSLAFSPDGQRLASGSDDTSVKIWDVESGRDLFELRGHNGAISALAFSPKGEWLATAGAEGSVRLEPMKLEDLITIAKRRLSRPLTPRKRGEAPD